VRGPDSSHHRNTLRRSFKGSLQRPLRRLGDRGPTRCAWANGGPLDRVPHTSGLSSRDDRHLFEMLNSRGSPAGLPFHHSAQAENYRKAFAAFDRAVTVGAASTRGSASRSFGIRDRAEPAEDPRRTVATARQSWPPEEQAARGVLWSCSFDDPPGRSSALTAMGQLPGPRSAASRREQGADHSVRFPLRAPTSVTRSCMPRHGLRNDPHHDVFSDNSNRIVACRGSGLGGAIELRGGGLLTRPGHTALVVSGRAYETMKRCGLSSPAPAATTHPREALHIPSAGRGRRHSTRSSSR